MNKSIAAAAVVIASTLTLSPAVADDYTVSAREVVDALYFGQTSDGKSKDLLLLEMEGNTIHMAGAFVYSTGTVDDTFLAVAGDNTPRVVCIQSSKEKRIAAISTLTKKGAYNIVGEWLRFDNELGAVVLGECTFEFVQSY